MTLDELSHQMAPLLHALLTRLDEEQRLASQAAGTVTLDQSAVGRLSRMDAMQQQAMAQASLQRLLQQRRRVQAACDRIRDGCYGLCCACDVAIGRDRLMSDPATPFCMDCQQERDDKRQDDRHAAR